MYICTRKYIYLLNIHTYANIYICKMSLLCFWTKSLFYWFHNVVFKDIDILFFFTHKFISPLCMPCLWSFYTWFPINVQWYIQFKLLYFIIYICCSLLLRHTFEIPEQDRYLNKIVFSKCYLKYCLFLYKICIYLFFILTQCGTNIIFSGRRNIQMYLLPRILDKWMSKHIQHDKKDHEWISK